jgi:hypothetical protein
MWLRDPSLDSSAGQLAYRIDQELAHAGVPYFPVRYGWFSGLEILVPAQYAETVNAMRQRFEEEQPRATPATESGLEEPIEPQRLSRG